MTLILLQGILLSILLVGTYWFIYRRNIHTILRLILVNNIWYCNLFLLLMLSLRWWTLIVLLVHLFWHQSLSFLVNHLILLRLVLNSLWSQVREEVKLITIIILHLLLVVTVVKLISIVSRTLSWFLLLFFWWWYLMLLLLLLKLMLCLWSNCGISCTWIWENIHWGDCLTGRFLFLENLIILGWWLKRGSFKLL